MFRDSGDLSGDEPTGGGPIDSRTLAITTLSINVDTGDIYGVDVELNSALADFTTTDEDVGIDLESIVTHEAGHFLGLDHSTTFDAVMREDYRPGDLAPRTLKPDDIAGICSIYPDDRSIEENTCDPRGKYSTECHEDGCGCRIAGGPSAPSRQGAWFALLAVGAFITRRARRA
jgi:MYXO-CTERM domain-containing protein